MIRGRTSGAGELEFFDSSAPNTVVAAVTEDGITGATGGSVTSDDITDATATGKAVLTAASQAAARTAIGAGTSSLALGTAAGTALVGNDARLAAGAVGAATVRALVGGTATTASASDHTHTGLMTGTVAAVNNSATFPDLATATTAYNALLAALRLRGIVSGA